MAYDADELAAVCAMVLIVYYIITNNLNNKWFRIIYVQMIIHNTNKK